MTDNPWDPISVPAEPSSLSVRRADPDHPFDFFWGRDFRKRCLLTLRFDLGSRKKKHSLPLLKGLELSEHMLSDIGKQQIILILKDRSNSDLFFRLCCDLLDATRNCYDEIAAVEITISRLWRWQQLMKQGYSEKLSSSEQKGLAGELCFIKDTLLKHFEPMHALGFWQGPIAGEGEKDFSAGESAAEIKVRTGTSPDQVRISSEGQLDHDNFKRLFLVVFVISSASSDKDNSFNLHRIVGQIRETLFLKQPETIPLFESKLTAYGYSELHDYEEDWFMLMNRTFFLVEEGFPRLVRHDLPNGIKSLNYFLELACCKDFETDEALVIKSFRGMDEIRNR